MVGRSLRNHGFKQDSADEEFPSLSKTTTKKQMISSQEEEEDNILDGIDVDQMTQNEIEDLKRALLESKKDIDMSQQYLYDDKTEEKSGSEHTPDMNEKTEVNNEYIEDDETQPPEQMEDDDFHLNLMEPTLVEEDNDDDDDDDDPVTVVSDVRMKMETTVDDETNDFGGDKDYNKRAADVDDDSGGGNKELHKAVADGKQYQTISDAKIELKHVPLRRHYRAVGTQTVRNDVCYFERGDSVSETSVKAIYQLFETFRLKLKQAQLQYTDKLSWGEPVKPGSHQSNTIDIKKRGQSSFYVDLDGSDENEITDQSSQGRETKTRRSSRSQTNSDDDYLPDLIIEEPSTFRTRSLRRRKLHSDSAKTGTRPLFSTHNDLNNQDSDNEFQELKPRTRKVKSRKKIDTPSSSNEILIEETQEFGIVESPKELNDFGLEKNEEIKVAETQSMDDDWLNVQKAATEVDSISPKHQTKLSDYSRKTLHNKSHSKMYKTVTIEEGFDNIEENLGEKNVIKIADMNAEVKENQQPVKHTGKKNKAKKTESKVLVEETQDLDLDSGGNIIPGKRVKRKCFKLGSSSEDDIELSIPETQTVDTPEQDSGECILNLDISDIEDGYGDKTAETNETVRHVSDAAMDESSQSPVIKKSKKLSGTLSDNATNTKAFDKENKKVDTNSISQRKPKTLNSGASNITNVRKGIILNHNASDAKTDLPKGVKRMFNRPVSEESIGSNISDDLSTTSSQRSGMVIDEQGDLYSTQFCNIKQRKRKREAKLKSDHSSVKNTFDEVMSLYTLDDDKKESKNETNTQMKDHLRPSSKRNPNVKRTVPPINKGIHGRKANFTVTVDEDSDIETKVGRRSESPDQEVTSNTPVKPGTSGISNIVQKPAVVLIDIETEDVNLKKSDLNQNTYDVQQGIRGNIHNKHEVDDKKMNANSDEDDYDSSTDIFVFSDNGEERENKKAKPQHKTRVKSNIVDNQNNNQRRGEETEDMVFGRRRFQHGDKTYEKKHKPKQEKTIVCPLCNSPFSENVIEAHAADCMGPVEGDTAEVTPDHSARNDNDRTPNRNNNQPVLTDNGHINLLEDPFNAAGGVLGQKPNTVQEEEVKTCWICENVIRDQYEEHVQRCYEETAKQQREIEQQGFRQQREHDREEPSPARATRNRLKQHIDGSDQVRVTKVEHTARDQIGMGRENTDVETTARSVRHGRKRKLETVTHETPPLDDR